MILTFQGLLISISFKLYDLFNILETMLTLPDGGLLIVLIYLKLQVFVIDPCLKTQILSNRINRPFLPK